MITPATIALVDIESECCGLFFKVMPAASIKSNQRIQTAAVMSDFFLAFMSLCLEVTSIQMITSKRNVGSYMISDWTHYFIRWSTLNLTRYSRNPLMEPTSQMRGPLNQETVGCKVSTPSKRLEGSLHRFIGWSLQMNRLQLTLLIEWSLERKAPASPCI